MSRIWRWLQSYTAYVRKQRNFIDILETDPIETVIMQLAKNIVTTLFMNIVWT